MIQPEWEREERATREKLCMRSSQVKPEILKFGRIHLVIVLLGLERKIQLKQFQKRFFKKTGKYYIFYKYACQILV
jgi:hypothetical protein